MRYSIAVIDGTTITNHGTFYDLQSMPPVYRTAVMLFDACEGKPPETNYTPIVVIKDIASVGYCDCGDDWMTCFIYAEWIKENK